MSRYLQQLFYESNLPITKHILHNSARPKQPEVIVIQKDENVLRALARLNEGNIKFRGLSPSAINTYLSCKLKFYFRQIAKIKEPKQVEEEIDARVLGTILHLAMELFYKRLLARKGNGAIVASDFDNLETKVSALIDEAFIDYYKLDKNKTVTYEGQRVVVREVVKDFVTRILAADKNHTPFEIVAVEENNSLYNVKIDHAPGYVVLGGKIDRIDRKDGRVRVIDYKTGNDKMTFKSIESLFGREKDRNKAAFQTILYAMLYLKNSGATKGVMPSLISRNNVYEGKNKFSLFLEKEEVTDVSVLMNEFEERLKLLLEEIFNPQEVFDQTDDLETCKFCPYREICYR
jgi:CRISPR/Cas system-associated exonuclease Cas4 (RecB family)